MFALSAWKLYRNGEDNPKLNGGRMEAEDLKFLRMKLKQSDYDWVDIMQAWIAIDELIKLREFRDKAFQAHPNIDLDIEQLAP